MYSGQIIIECMDNILGQMEIVREKLRHFFRECWAANTCLLLLNEAILMRPLVTVAKMDAYGYRGTTIYAQRHISLMADFTTSIDEANRMVAFADTSTPAEALTGWDWNFGDGTTSSLQHPTHTYTSTGTYTITLTITAGSETRSTTQTITLAEPPVAGPCPDAAFEPDNTQSDAIPLRPSQFVQRVLCVPGDVDWYVFQGVANITYTLKTQDLGIDVMTILTLYNAAGQEIATSEPSSSDIKARYQSTLHFRPTTSGMYAVAVRLWEPDWGHAAAVYTLSLESDTCADPAPLAPTRETAITLPIGTRVSHALCTPDRDVFRIDATANTIYQVEVSSYGQDLAGTLGMTMSDSLGTQTTVAPYHWRSPTVADRTVRRDYIYADTDAPWFLFLRSLNTADPAGWYDIQVTPISCSDAATEPNNIRAEAALLTLPQSYTGSFCQPDDDDWFAVDVQAGTTYRFGVSSTHPDFTLNAMRLYAAGLESHVAWASYPYALTYTPSTSGRYYLLLDPLAQTSHPESVYTLDVSTDTSCSDPFDPPSGPMTPTLTVDTWVEHHFCTSTDLRDVSTVTVPTTATYEFAVDTGVTGVKVTLFRNNQQVVQAPSYNNPVLLSHELYPGTYQLVTERSAVGAQGDRSLAYQVCVSTRSCYDQAEPNNTWDRATPLALGAVHAGVLHAYSRDAQDIDYLALELEAGVLYDITFDGEPGFLPDVTVERGAKEQHTSLQAATSHGTLAFLPPHTATYLLRIDQTKGNVGELYPYTVRVTPRMSVREHTPNETPDQAIAVAVGTPYVGRLYDGADVDWYAIHVPADGYYDLHMTDMGPFTNNIIVALYDDGLNIVQQRFGTPDRTARERAFDPVFLQQRTYFIRIMDTDFDSTYANARYTLRLVPVERPDDTRDYTHGPQNEFDLDQADAEADYITEINDLRTSFGLAPLAVSPELTAAADRHSTDMETNGFLGHDGSDGTTPITRTLEAGYGYPAGRENAFGCREDNLRSCQVNPPFTSISNPVPSWKSSAGHRRNLLSATHRELGLATSPNGRWATFLGAYRPTVYPVFLNNDAAATSSHAVTVTLSPPIESGFEFDPGWDYAVGHVPDFAQATWHPLTMTTRTFTDTYTDIYQPGQPTFTDVHTHTAPILHAWTLQPGSGLKTVFVAYRRPEGHISISQDTIWVSTPAVASPLMPPLPPLPQYFQDDTFVGAESFTYNINTESGLLPPTVSLLFNSFMVDASLDQQSSSLGMGATLAEYAVLRVPDATPDVFDDDTFTLVWEGMLWPLVATDSSKTVYRLERDVAGSTGIAGRNITLHRLRGAAHGIDHGTHWRLSDNDDLTWTFGATADSAWRYLDSTHTAHIWRWNLNRVDDIHTNYQLWNYATETSTLNGTPFDRGGYITHIRWNGNATLSMAPDRSVTFHYNQRLSTNPAADAPGGATFFITKKLTSIDVLIGQQQRWHYTLDYDERADGKHQRLVLKTLHRSSNTDSLSTETVTFAYADPAVSGEGYRVARIERNGSLLKQIAYTRTLLGTTPLYAVSDLIFDMGAGERAHRTLSYGDLLTDPSGTQFWGYESRREVEAPALAKDSQAPHLHQSTANTAPDDAGITGGGSHERRNRKEPPTMGYPFKDFCELFEPLDAPRGLQSDQSHAATTGGAGICHKYVANLESTHFAHGGTRIEATERFEDILQTDGSYQRLQTNTTYGAQGQPIYIDRYGEHADSTDDVFVEQFYHDLLHPDRITEQRTLDSRGRMLNRTTYAYEPTTGLLREQGEWLIEEGRVLSTTYTYTERGLLATETNSLGQTTTFGYTPSGQRETVTDPRGFTQRTTYDAYDRLSTETDAHGATTHYTYDPQTGKVATHTDAYGNRTSFTYDTRGRRIAQTNARGFTTHYAYNDHDLLVVMTDTLGYATHYEYDSYGHRIAIIDALGNRTEHTYDRTRGWKSASRDAVGFETAYFYDGAGRHVGTTDPRGATTTVVYDGFGRIVETVDALGHTTTTDYDALDRQVKTTNALSGTTFYQYDSLNRLVVMTDTLGYPTRYRYDDAGRVVQTMNPRGAVTQTTYDANGRPTHITDALSQTIAYEYDAVGNQVVMTDALGYRTEMTYDLLGRQRAVRSPLGFTTRYEYDEVGNQTVLTDTRGFVHRSTYDAANRLLATTDPLSHTTFYGYDAVGNQVVVTNSVGYVSYTTYDAKYRVLAQTDPLSRTRYYGYDAGGLTTAVTDTRGVTTTTTHDLLGRPIQAQDGAFQTTSSEYDALGRMIRQTDEVGIVTAFTYDAAGQLTDVIENYRPGDPADAETNVHTQYTYDATGNLLTVTDPRGMISTNEYDLLNRLVLSTDPLSTSERLTYTPRGQIATRTDAKQQQTRYVYDAEGRLTTIDYPDGTPDVTYAYDPADNVTTMTDGVGVTTYTYDSLNRMQTRTRTGRTVTYTYTAESQLASIDYWGQGTVAYTYDAAGQIAHLTPWNEQATTYTYHAPGQIESIARANGVRSTYSFDRANRITRIQHMHGHSHLQDFRYTHNARGMRLTKHEYSGTTALTTTATYDPLSRLASIQYPAIPAGPAATSTTYTYDAAGNRVHDGNTHSTYNEANQQTHFSYDPNGNLLDDGTTAYRYDGANRLIETLTHGITTSYAYDGWGNLVAETVQTTTTLTATEFILDEQAAHTRILGAYRSTGEHTLYAYGPEGVHAHHASQTGISYTLLDDQGSIYHLSDTTGAVVTTSIYDAWGALRYQTGTVSIRLGYTGELMNPVDGTVFLRARHYTPAHGRFLQRDTFAGMPTRPQSLHRYTYAENNPLHWIDPSGHAVDEYGHWTPCILFAQQSGCALDDFVDWWGSDDGEDFKRFGKRLIQRAMETPGDILDGLWLFVDDPLTAMKYAIQAPGKALLDIGVGALCDDPERLADGVFDTFGMLIGASRAYKIVDGSPPRNGPDDPGGPPRDGPDGPPLPPCMGNSFVAGTLVESINGLVPIETLEEGDLVWAVDPETGAAGWYPITWTTKHEDADLVTLSVTPISVDGEALSSTQEHTIVVIITATLEHPFWVEGIGWMNAGDLDTGDVLLSADGRRLVVQAAVRSSGPAMVYNFTVDALHTYTVTELRVVVHNINHCLPAKVTDADLDNIRDKHTRAGRQWQQSRNPKSYFHDNVTNDELREWIEIANDEPAVFQPESNRRSYIRIAKTYDESTVGYTLNNNKYVPTSRFAIIQIDDGSIITMYPIP